jgi:hypothetical protein
VIDADRVRAVAREVLGRPAYDDLTPSLPEVWLERVRGVLADLLDALLGSGAATGIGRVVAIVVVVLLLLAGVALLLGLRRRGGRDAVVDLPAGEDARSLLAAAEAARRAGDHEQAVRARYGALVLALVEGGVLVARPGLTVGEVSATVRTAAPTARSAVVAAGGALADVVYGDEPAGPAEDDVVAAGVRAVAGVLGRRDLVPAVSAGGAT